MLYNHIIHIRYDVTNNKTTYERLYNNKIMRYDIIFGVDSIIEIMYFFSLRNQKYNYYNVDNNELFSIKFIFKESIEKFENDLFDFLYKHRCSII